MSPLTRRLRKVAAPLTKAEERLARKIVAEHVRQDYPSETEPRFHVFSPELRVDKPARRGAVPTRLIRALVADYGKRRILDFTLDRRGRVVSVEPYRGLAPAPDREELRRAQALAKEDDRSAPLARRRRVFVSEFAPETGDQHGARLIGLRYVLAQKGNGFEELARVVVSLSERRVVSFESGQTLRGR